MYINALCSHILRNNATHIQIDSTSSHCFTLNTLIVISPPQIQAFLYSVSHYSHIILLLWRPRHLPLMLFSSPASLTMKMMHGIPYGSSHMRARTYFECIVAY